jgi:HEAT repeat protein
MMDDEIDRLVERARSDQPAERSEAVVELRRRLRLPRDSALLGRVMSQALNDPDPLVRAEGAEALGEPELIPWHGPLIGALQGDEDAMVRACAAESLGDAGNREAVSALRAALDDEDEAVRGYAAASLGTVGDHDDAEVLRGRADTAMNPAGKVIYLAAVCRIDACKADIDALLSAIASLTDEISLAPLNALEGLLARRPSALTKRERGELRRALEDLSQKLAQIHQGQLRKLFGLLDAIELQSTNG